MQVLYLLCSTLSTFFTSVALSLLLPLHALLRHWCRSPATSDAPESVTLYEGTVWHERRRPVHHSFQYSVRYALIDLDRAPHSPPGHLSADKAREFAGTKGRVLLLTIPPSVGYEQNPLSLYYCCERIESDQDLRKCIAEVTNSPWGERVTFVFNPNSDLVAKLLHISPFMSFLLWWKNVPFLEHPRYSNPAYRERASIRERELSCPWAMSHVRGGGGGNDSASLSDKTGAAGRCFAWRDAKWPWA